MCNRFIEDFVNKIVEKNSLWLWIYAENEEDIKFLLIEADNRKDAILKLKDYKYVGSLFHPNFNIFTKDLDLYIERFEIELYYDRGMNFQLVDLSKVDRI